MSWDGGRVWRGAVVLAAVWVFALGFTANKGFFHDDAFIGLRYARNLISGHGLVWNSGERVEGYTNGLFTLLEGLLGAAGVDLVVASRVINISAFAGLILVAWVGAPGRPARDGGDRALAMVPTLLVLTSFPLIVWIPGGLEGPLFAALSGSAIGLLCGPSDPDPGSRSTAASGVLFGLACAVRMDGLLFIPVSLGFLLFASRESRPARLPTFLCAFLATFLPYFLWRLLYYGSPVPNTFWVKAAGGSWSRMVSGLDYLASYAATPPYLLALAGLALVYSLVRRSFDRRTAYLLGVVVVYLLYVVYVGGDYMPAFRMVLPVIFPAALLVGSALARATPPSARWTGMGALAGLLFLTGLQVDDPRVNPRYTDPAAFVGTIVGRHIASAWPPGDLVALNTAGSTPYYAGDLRFLDMLGLNDAHIARRAVAGIEVPWQVVPGHLKGDGAYVLGRRPDYVIIGPAEGATVRDPMFLSDLEIARDPRFPADYALRQERLDVSGLTGFRLYPATRTGVLTFTYYERRTHGE